ncbi:remodeling and spacing factor 1-like [Telopea speciosissima]|uniref:remodeling and spacing factor 1-like n=1 Tax=Telopea speciosissima TaxID=54955 RepID=UPI001CC3688F|nr:remodeling and spacing factor 1-like [Telopea speciosissima]
MANGTDAEQFVLLSGVRTGLKREFAFALKVQSELSGSLGRTRARKFQNSPTANAVSENSNNKRFKNSHAKKESKDDAAKPQIEEEQKRELDNSVPGEEPEVDLAKVLSEEERKNDGPEESKNDQVEFPSEREKIEILKPLKEEGSSMEFPMLIDDGIKNQRALLEKPLRRFTRSALKAKAKPVEVLETTNGGSVASEDLKERKSNEPKEEPMSESVKSPSKENHQSDLVRPATPAREVKAVGEVLSERNTDQKRSDVEEQPKSDPTRPQTEEGTCAESPMVIDSCSEVPNVSLERPPRRFTRSALKPKVEPMEVSASAGGDSVVPEDAKDETSKKGGSVISDDAKTIAIVGGEGKITDVVSPLTASLKKKLEMKMSKKIALTKFPSKVRELLDTGMLDGLAVKYLLRGNKRGIRGVIKDAGILCSCDSCKERKVITPLQFEQHAGSLNKRPADYIYLENGNSLRDVMNACKDAPLDALEATIQRAIGSSPVKDATVCQKDAAICQNCKRPFTPSRTRRSMFLCSSCIVAQECQESSPCMTGGTARSSKPLLTPKSSNSASRPMLSPKSNSSKGKITRKDLRLHKLVFEEGGLPEGTEVAYYARGQKLLEGYKKGFGIFCCCCNSEVSPSQFEAHAGWASRRKPYLHIFTSNGVSLHELSISLSKGRKLSSKDNDDLCTICADGGDLLLCDGCPRAFHKDCVSLSSIPRGNWYCKYCQNMFQKEKFVQHNMNAMAAGRVLGVDPIEQISQRCIRIVNTSEADVGGCSLCRGHGFSKSRFGPRTVLLCDQCEKEFHVGCLRDHKMADLKELPKGKWFCCMDCNRINSALQKLLVCGPEKLPHPLSNIIKKKHEEKGSDDTDLDVRWRLLSGKIACPETKLLLSKAVAIFHDRFDPIVDSTTGRDLIPPMVYGRNIRDQEFGGMYCAVLTVNSSVVSAGILRIFGTEVAELPLVATKSDNQGQGYFQSLFSCIERLLGFLHVKKLVLPAADEAESIWTKKFDFTKIAPDELSKLRRECQMMTFQGTSMLQKPVPKCRVVGSSSEDS